MRVSLLSLAAALALAGCSNPEATGRYLIAPPTPSARVPDRLGTAELRDVSLPDYAASGEISWQTADGAVRSNTKTLWADKPERGFTLALARAISDMSGATVIAEPWPLAEPPRRRIEVRVEQALAGMDGIYRLGGRYYVAQDSAGGANHARSFAIAVPIPQAAPASGRRKPPAPPAAIAAAQNAAIAQLAAQIATLGGPGAVIRTSAPAPEPLFTMEPLPPLEPLEPLPDSAPLPSG